MINRIFSLFRDYLDQHFAILNRKMDKLMSGQDDFNAALTALQTEAQTVETSVASLLDQLTAAKNNGDDEAFEAAAGQLTSVTSALASSIQAIPPASAPAPAPQPAA